MIYFYLWVLFLLAIIFAVPIVSFLEKSRARKAAGPAIVEESAAVEDVPSYDNAAVEEAMPSDDLSEFGQPVPADADDFSAFEDFK